jgi:hypothetical protein
MEELLSKVDQFDGIVLVWREFVVEKWSPKTTWNCGLTSPVVVLRTSGTEEAWLGDIPK